MRTSSVTSSLHHVGLLFSLVLRSSAYDAGLFWSSFFSCCPCCTGLLESTCQVWYKRDFATVNYLDMSIKQSALMVMRDIC